MEKFTWHETVWGSRKHYAAREQQRNKLFSNDMRKCTSHHVQTAMIQGSLAYIPQLSDDSISKQRRSWPGCTVWSGPSFFAGVMKALFSCYGSYLCIKTEDLCLTRQIHYVVWQIYGLLTAYSPCRTVKYNVLRLNGTCDSVQWKSVNGKSKMKVIYFILLNCGFSGLLK